MFGRLKELIAKIRIDEKKRSWIKNGHIFIDSSVIIFLETSIYAAMGKVKVGKNTCIRGTLEIQRENGIIEIGDNCYIGDYTRIWAAERIIIGDHVLIAHNVNIFDNDTHPTDYLERRNDAYNIIFKGIRKNYPSLKSKPVVIEEDAWIGCNSVILKGVKIGRRAVVASGSVVTKDVPPETMVAGNPARVVKLLKKEVE